VISRLGSGVMVAPSLSLSPVLLLSTTPSRPHYVQNTVHISIFPSHSHPQPVLSPPTLNLSLEPRSQPQP
jgi:hypothetical protein